MKPHQSLLNQCTIALALATSVLLLSGCAMFQPVRATGPIAANPVRVSDPERGTLDPAWLQPSMDIFTLGPGDRVEIDIPGEEGSAALTVVGPDGKIYYQMLEGIDVWGKTLDQARVAIEQRLAEYYREPPRVNISLQEVGSKRVWMLGRLNTPGVYPLTGPTTLLEAISRAGGPAPGQTAARLSTGGTALIANSATDAGDLSRAFVVRGGRPLPVDLRRLLYEGDTSQNIYLQPDDMIYLPSPRSQEIYVLGAVGRAQALNMPQGATLASAIAAAGGTGENAYLSHVAIVRGPVNGASIAVYDYRAIVTGKEPDVVLEPNDIVYVPLTPYRVLTRYLDLIVSTFVRTVGVNAGAKAANVDADLGLNVIVPSP
jgi:polysaccharide biosynthesis/export protein